MLMLMRYADEKARYAAMHIRLKQLEPCGLTAAGVDERKYSAVSYAHPAALFVYLLYLRSESTYRAQKQKFEINYVAMVLLSF